MLAVTACAGNISVPTVTLSPFAANFVESAVDDADDAGLRDQEARCIAQGILGRVSEARLVELGVSADGSGGSFLGGVTDVTARERTAITGVFEGCLDDPWEWLFPIATNDDRCIRDGVREAGITLEQLLFAEVPEYEELVGQALVTAATSCAS